MNTSRYIAAISKPTPPPPEAPNNTICSTWLALGAFGTEPEAEQAIRQYKARGWPWVACAVFNRTDTRAYATLLAQLPELT